MQIKRSSTKCTNKSNSHHVLQSLLRNLKKNSLKAKAEEHFKLFENSNYIFKITLGSKIDVKHEGCVCVCRGEFSVMYPQVWNINLGTSLVVQWLRIRLPMQGTRVQALVQEDPTCRGATNPVRHSFWACVLEPVSHNYWAHVPQLPKPACLEPVLCNTRSHCNEKPTHCNEE